jgi:HSP20 family protein
MTRMPNRLERWLVNPVREEPFPAVNLWEEEENVYVEAELPGVAPETFELYVTEANVLEMVGEFVPPPVEKRRYFRCERRIGKFHRVLELPALVDPDKVEVRLERGLLLVKLAKAEAAKPRKIEVKAG